MLFKKVAVVAAAAALALSLAGCSGQQQETKEQSEPASTQTTSNERQDLQITDSGFYFDNSGYAHYAAIVSNPNTGWAVQNAKVIVTGKDANGNIVGSDTQYIVCLFANGKTAVGMQTSFTGAKTLEFQTSASNSNSWVQESTQQATYDEAIYAQNINETDQGYGNSNVTGEVVNNSKGDFSSCPIIAVFKDANGKIVGGNSTYVDLPQGVTTPFSISGYQVAEHASVDVYVGFGWPQNS